MTRHSFIRAKERANLNESAARKNFVKAYSFGVRADQLPAIERKYMKERSEDDVQMVLYGEYLYLFAEEGKCITMYHMPGWFGKKSKFKGKEKINHPKKYFNHYCMEPMGQN